jgi:CheY-like chemotaxis protein
MGAQPNFRIQQGAAQSSARPLTREQETVKQRVLVVDDNYDSADSLATLLRFLGHEVQTAFDGLEAVNAALDFHPSIMLLDIGLPKLNGYEVARRVRTQPGGDAIKLVALTGWSQDEDIRRAHEAGFDLHLVKPIGMVVLRKLMAEELWNGAGSKEEK